jgi:hypothetical protein
MSEVVIRPAEQDDLETLWAFLAVAAYESDAAAAQAVPIVAAHLAGGNAMAISDSSPS